MSNVNVTLAPNNAGPVVAAGFATAQSYASAANSMAITFLNGLSATANTLATLPSISLGVPTLGSAPTAFAKPIAPSDSTDLVFQKPIAPGDISISLPSALTADAAPVFSATPLPVATIAAPSPLSATLPALPALTDVTVPAAPGFVLPDVPTMLGITIPSAPMLDLQHFAGVPATGPVAPGIGFSFAEPTYTSSLLDDLRSVLHDWVLGNSEILPPAVEQAIWERARTRENVNAGRKIKEVLRSFALRGFAKPPGAMAVEMTDAVQEAQDAGSSLSRDISIKQAEMGIENRKFAFEEAFKVESQLITYQNLIAQRAFEAERVVMEAAIQLYQASVGKYQADVQAFLATVEAHRADLQTELARLEEYKTAIEAQRLIGEVNARAVEIYRARVEAVKSIVEIFRAEVEAANTQAMVNKTRIDGYASQVGAYGEQVRAKAAEYEGYATQVRAELGKTEIYKTQSDAYRSQVEGFAALVNARAQSKALEYRGVDAQLDLFKTRTEIFRSNVEAESSRVRAAATAQEVRVQSFTAQVQGEAARVAADSTTFAATSQVAIQSSNLGLEALKANVQALIQKTNALIEAMKSGAGVSAQLAASALSSIHLSGSVSDAYGQNASVGASESWNHNEDTTTV